MGSLSDFNFLNNDSTEMIKAPLSSEPAPNSPEVCLDLEQKPDDFLNQLEHCPSNEKDFWDFFSAENENKDQLISEEIEIFSTEFLDIIDNANWETTSTSPKKSSIADYWKSFSVEDEFTEVCTDKVSDVSLPPIYDDSGYSSLIYKTGEVSTSISEVIEDKKVTTEDCLMKNMDLGPINCDILETVAEDTSISSKAVCEETLSQNQFVGFAAEAEDNTRNCEVVSEDIQSQNQCSESAEEDSMESFELLPEDLQGQNQCAESATEDSVESYEFVLEDLQSPNQCVESATEDSMKNFELVPEKIQSQCTEVKSEDTTRNFEAVSEDIESRNQSAESAAEDYLKNCEALIEDIQIPNQCAESAAEDSMKNCEVIPEEVESEFEAEDSFKNCEALIEDIQILNQCAESAAEDSMKNCEVIPEEVESEFEAEDSFKNCDKLLPEDFQSQNQCTETLDLHVSSTEIEPQDYSKDDQNQDSSKLEIDNSLCQEENVDPLATSTSDYDLLKAASDSKAFQVENKNDTETVRGVEEDEEKMSLQLSEDEVSAPNSPNENSTSSGFLVTSVETVFSDENSVENIKVGHSPKKVSEIINSDENEQKDDQYEISLCLSDDEFDQFSSLSDGQCLGTGTDEEIDNTEPVKKFNDSGTFQDKEQVNLTFPWVQNKTAKSKDKLICIRNAFHLTNASSTARTKFLDRLFQARVVLKRIDPEKNTPKIKSSQTHKEASCSSVANDDRPWIYFCVRCQIRYRDASRRSCDNCNSRVSYQCKKCKKNYSNRSECQSHVRQVCSAREYLSCTSCDYRTQRRYNMTRHRRTHLNEPGIVLPQKSIKRVRCNHCSFNTSFKRNLTQHIFHHHPDIFIKREPEETEGFAMVDCSGGTNLGN